MYRATIGTRRYTFPDLKTLMARASPLRSGDVLAGIAAETGEERVAAQFALADLPLATFLTDQVVPDEVTAEAPWFERASILASADRMALGIRPIDCWSPLKSEVLRPRTGRAACTSPVLARWRSDHRAARIAAALAARGGGRGREGGVSLAGAARDGGGRSARTVKVLPPVTGRVVELKVSSASGSLRDRNLPSSTPATSRKPIRTWRKPAPPPRSRSRRSIASWAGENRRRGDQGSRTGPERLRPGRSGARPRGNAPAVDRRSAEQIVKTRLLTLKAPVAGSVIDPADRSRRVPQRFDRTRP